MIRLAPIVCLIAAVFVGARARAQAPKAETKVKLPPEVHAEIETLASELNELVRELKNATTAVESKHDLVADVALTHKAAKWVLKLGEFYSPNDGAKTIATLRRGLDAGGNFARASIPGPPPAAGPFAAMSRGLTVPCNRTRSMCPSLIPTPAPPGWNVILHGRGATLTEVSFFQQS